MTELIVKYGTEKLSLKLPRGEFIGQIEPITPIPEKSPQEILAQALAEPYQSPRLRELAQGKHSAAILIPGKTRVAATQYYVPALVAELTAAGIPMDKIEVFLATGTHERHLECDFNQLLGEELASKLSCQAHDCRAKDELVELGTTSFGTPVLFSKRVLEADIKILTGRIVPHYFAGFSGGRKALVPGVAGWETIVANHRLTLDPQQGIHPQVKACSLTHNPIHLDMMEAVQLVKPDFCLNTILDVEHRLIGAVAGDFVAAHEAGCQQVQAMFHREMPQPVDLLITSPGGHPYDCNFMQSIKAILNISAGVRPGGAILWLAECPAGIQAGFSRWLQIASDEELEKAIRKNYDLMGHNSLMLRQLTRKAKVGLCSSLSPETVQGLGFEPLQSFAAGIEWILKQFPEHFTYAFVPYANVTSISCK